MMTGIQHPCQINDPAAYSSCFSLTTEILSNIYIILLGFINPLFIQSQDTLRNAFKLDEVD